MIILSVVATIAAGVLGAYLGAVTMEFPELGLIVAVAVMGGFIMAELRRREKK